MSPNLVFSHLSRQIKMQCINLSHERCVPIKSSSNLSESPLCGGDCTYFTKLNILFAICMCMFEKTKQNKRELPCTLIFAKDTHINFQKHFRFNGYHEEIVGRGLQQNDDTSIYVWQHLFYFQMGKRPFRFRSHLKLYKRTSPSWYMQFPEKENEQKTGRK